MSLTKIAPMDVQHRIGEVAGVSDWLLITQDRVTAFGGITLDFDSHHIDPQAAALGPFGVGTAQGFLTLSLLPYLISACDFTLEHREHINYGLNRVRFTAPVVVGKRVRAKFTYASAQQRPDGAWLFNIDVEMEQEGETKPCLLADWLMLVSD